MKLIPKDWEKHQHYKDRKPQWIKLHRDLLNDFSYSMVQIGTKATLPLLWLLACEYEDGIIDATLEEISFRVHIDIKTVETAIEEIVKIGLFSIDSTLVQNGTDPEPREEKRRDREETEKEEDTRIAKTHTEIPLSQRTRVGQRIVKKYKNFMEMKEHLAANHNKYKDLSIEFEGEKWGIGRNGIPWSRKNVDDMPFEQRKLFWLHLISYQHLLEA